MLNLRFFSPLCSTVRARLETRPILRCFSRFGTDLERWQRRCDRLTRLQRRIRFPPLETITVNGQNIKLPLPCTEPMRTPSQVELEYLVGFFDGDGCVSMTKETGKVQLAISQNVDSAEVLLHFRSFIAGSVHRQSASTGSKQAVLQWRVYRPKMAAAAAETLSRVPSMKQAQLREATKGRVAENDRARVGQSLQTFKQRQHVSDQRLECSWPYFAGLFDAEGCISVNVNYAGLQLRLGQVNPCVLVYLFRFLQENELHSWSLRDRAACSSLACTKMQNCKKTLELLLANGLLVKRKQAELALSLTAENHLEIRDAISSLSGLQGRYQRLDADGIARTREIQRLQQRLRYISGPAPASMLSQIEELQAEHMLQKLISRCDMLRKDMRRSMRQGGVVVSSTIHSSELPLLAERVLLPHVSVTS